MPRHIPPAEPAKAYRFGFVLSTALGNKTRFEIFKKFAERDEEVECVWAPVSHFVAPGEHDRYSHLPGFLHRRAIVFDQARPVLSRLDHLDAVMLHMYEVDLWLACRALVLSSPVRIVSADDAPALDEATYPLHPVDRAKPNWRRAVRRRIDVWRARRADLLIPFSHWAAGLLVSAGVEPDRVQPVHTGMDLGLWAPPPGRSPGQPVRLLFVGGEFERKGGYDLLRAFASLRGQVELDIVSKSAPVGLPVGVQVHSDLGPGDDRLRDLYRRADVLVHPTRSDLSPWVVLEGMASGCATVVSDVGGVPEFVDQGVTGLVVQRADIAGLTAALQTLVDRPDVRIEMGRAGRRRVEAEYDASVNVQRTLDLMKAASRHRAASSGRTTRRPVN